MTEPMATHTPRDPSKKIIWKGGSSEHFEGAPSSRIPLSSFPHFTPKKFKKWNRNSAGAGGHPPRERELEPTRITQFRITNLTLELER